MRKWLAPEVVQSSALDCGPAALKSLLEGFDIPASYGRLREACQTGLDGTSIDTMEAVANQLGLRAEQIMLPVDHLLVAEAKTLPALLVVQLPDGMTHFVVVWRQHGHLLQVMDPAVGRRWIPDERFLEEVYRHRMAVPADGWREFAVSEDFQNALRVRMKAARISRSEADRLCRSALADNTWKGLATLDAAVRLLQSLRAADAVTNSSECVRVLAELQQTPELIPPAYWSVRSTEPDEEGKEQLSMCGAVLVRVLGKQTEATLGPISTELQAATNEKPLRPLRELMKYAAHTGIGSLLLLACGLVISSAGVLVEALLFRSLLDITSQLHMAGQRGAGMAAIVFVSVTLLLLDVFLMNAFMRLGRSMEMQLRIAFLRKIPKLGDRYFQSRLTSDMAERSHVTHQLRHMAELAKQFASATLKLCFTAVALIWLDPGSWLLVLLIAVTALMLPVLTQSLLADRELRVRSHAGALTRYVLDALLGLVALRAHGAERKLRSEQEKLLGRWGEASLRLQQTVVRIEAIQLVAMFGFSVALLLQHRMQGAEIGRVLLTIYWTLSLPGYGQDIWALARKLPYYRSLTLRLLEPLGAPEEADVSGAGELIKEGGPSVSFRDVSVQAAGHAILSGINLEIQAGSQVAVVGPSGAGKSSLVGLLLGWWKPSQGEIQVDGGTLVCEQLRQRTAWVDPSVQLWNRSLFSNIQYGSHAQAPEVGTAINAATLRNVLESLPDGLQTTLGEGGAFVSGGEGQRVRFARAVVRPDVRFVVLDEPFRGLDRERRRELLSRARKLWRKTTLICVTHDIQETLDFDQVVVLEGGQIAETGDPRELAADQHSRYAQLLRAERHARTNLWSGAHWRRIRVQSGRVVETIRDASHLADEEVA